MMSSARAGDAFPTNGVGTTMLGVDVNGNLAPLRSTNDQATTNEIHAPAANTAAVLTFAAVTGVAHVVKDMIFSYTGTGTLAGGNLLIQDGSDTVFSMDVSAKEWGCLPITRIGHSGRAMTITLAAGGADVTGKLNASHYTVTVTAGGAFDFSDEVNSGLLMMFF